MHSDVTDTPVSIVAPDGVAIPALVAEPRARVPGQCLLLHGITTHKNEFGDFFPQLAQLLGAAGYRSLRIDFRGHGDSAEPQSAFSITSQVLDTMTAAAWLRETAHNEPLHFVGCSFGAPPAIFTARALGSAVGSLTLVSPVLDYERTFLRPTSEWASALFSSEAQRDAFRSGRLRMSEHFEIDVKLLVEMSLVKPFLELDAVQARTAIVHGREDSMVPYEISEAYAKSYPTVDFVSIDAMDHGFNHVDDELGTSPESLSNIRHIAGTILANIAGQLR